MVSKSDFLSYISGQQQAGEFIAHERQARLPNLTNVQAREEYDSLCSVLEKSYMKQSRNPSFEDFHCRFLVHRRQILNRLANTQ